MKLVRSAAFAFVALSAACASKPVAPPSAPSNAVSTTRVNAAIWEEDATPRVGKPQRSDDASPSDDSLDSPKDAPRRNEGKHGGFSGWK